MLDNFIPKRPTFKTHSESLWMWDVTGSLKNGSSKPTKFYGEKKVSDFLA